MVTLCEHTVRYYEHTVTSKIHLGDILLIAIKLERNAKNSIIHFYSRTGGGGKVKISEGVSDCVSRLSSEYDGGASSSKPGSDSYIGIGY